MYQNYIMKKQKLNDPVTSKEGKPVTKQKKSLVKEKL